MSRPFHSLYISENMRAGRFLPRGAGDPADRAARTRAAVRPLDPGLLAELRAQQAALPPSPAREAHLEALAKGAAVAVTGQQVGLFLGPLYTLHKAASVVAVARALSAEAGVPVVPLFWLQTEDHDWPEIASCATPRDGAEPLRLALADDPARSRVSVEHRALGPEVAGLLDQLAAALEGAPHAAEVLALLRAHYRPGAPIAQAFAGVLAALFAEDGLLVFDPRREVPARLAAPVLARANAEAPRLDALLQERGAELRAAGLREQIALRPGSPLFFLHPEGPTGPRYRLVPDGDRYALSGAEGRFTRDALAAALAQEPLRFSTSALLRPLVQDTLLPTAAYVGGPAEVDYFAQLAPLYDAFAMEPPLVVLRNRFRLLTPRVRTLLSRLALSPADLDAPREALLARLASRSGEVPGPTWLAELEARLDAYEKAAPALDPALARAAERTRATARRALERLARHHGKVALQREQAQADRLERVLGWLRPEGAPQERVFAFPAFAALSGVQGLVRAVSAAVRPFDPSVREVEL